MFRRRDTGRVPTPPTGFPSPLPNDRCPCLSGSPYGECCAPFLAGAADAPTAVQLMRSRYTAYVVGDRSYLLATWHPSTRPTRLELDPARAVVPARHRASGARRPARPRRHRGVPRVLPARRRAAASSTRRAGSSARAADGATSTPPDDGPRRRRPQSPSRCPSAVKPSSTARSPDSSSSWKSVICTPAGASSREFRDCHGVTTGSATTRAAGALEAAGHAGGVGDLEGEPDVRALDAARLDAVDRTLVRGVRDLEGRSAGIEDDDAFVAPLREGEVLGQAERVTVERDRGLVVGRFDDDAELQDRRCCGIRHVGILAAPGDIRDPLDGTGARRARLTRRRGAPASSASSRRPCSRR